MQWLPGPPSFGHLLPIHLISQSFFSHSSPATPGSLLLLDLSSFQLIQALHLLFLWPGRFFPQIHGSLLYLFLMSTLMSPYQRSLPWQPYIKWHLLPLMLFSNLLALLHFSLVLTSAWHNSIYVLIICIPPENKSVLKDRFLSVLLTIRSYEPNISLLPSRCSINTLWMDQ